MFRLGTRPERKRTSLPPEPSTSSFSALTLEIETGTSWMFSTLRCAVTSTVSRVAASFSAVVVAASWAKAVPNGSRAAMAKARRCGRTTAGQSRDMAVGFRVGGGGARRGASTRMLHYSNKGGNGRKSHSGEGNRRCRTPAPAPVRSACRCDGWQVTARPVRGLDSAPFPTAGSPP